MEENSTELNIQTRQIRVGQKQLKHSLPRLRCKHHIFLTNLGNLILRLRKIEARLGQGLGQWARLGQGLDKKQGSGKVGAGKVWARLGRGWGI